MYAYRFSEIYFKYKTEENLINAIKNNEVEYLKDIRNTVISGEWKKYAEAIKKYMDKNNIGVIMYSSPEYPQKLRYISDPPSILYYKGNIELLNQSSIAVIGSRHSSLYGRRCAEKFCSAFAENGICVVSGMADGIDGCAHKTALDKKGNTIAVLGCGVDVIYPPTNSFLYDNIAKDGLVISEFPLKSKPQRGNFPYRNRLIIGLSECLLVVEAGLPSGTMSTVDFALDQGKDVYAVPGNIDSPTSMGTNYLIKNGSFCADDPSDVLNAFGEYSNNYSKKCKVQEADGIQKEIVDILFNEPMSFNELENRLSYNTEELNTALMLLEISGIIEKDSGRIYSLNK